MVDLVPHDLDRTEQREPQSSLRQDGIHKVTSLFLGDDSGSAAAGTKSTRAQVEHYSAEVLKTVPLFLPAV